MLSVALARKGGLVLPQLRGPALNEAPAVTASTPETGRTSGDGILRCLLAVVAGFWSGGVLGDDIQPRSTAA